MYIKKLEKVQKKKKKKKNYKFTHSKPTKQKQNDGQIMNTENYPHPKP